MGNQEQEVADLFLADLLSSRPVAPPSCLIVAQESNLVPRTFITSETNQKMTERKAERQKKLNPRV